jgi:uroporphyrinogen-III synthase
VVTPGPLDGFSVGVTADRRGDDQAVLLGRLGVEVVRGPVLRTELDAVDADLRRVTDRLVASPPDVLVANTGFGMRAWWARAEAWDLAGALGASLGQARIVARGPKAAGALRSIGLPVAWRAPDEQLATVVGHLVADGVAGLTVAVQLHGDDDPTAGRLRAAGARVVEVPVYRWRGAADATAARSLVARCCDGTVDAVTFTAGPAVRHFLDVAESDGVADTLLAALNRRMLAVCVGPVCAAVAVDEGVVAPVVPEHWRLGAMVTLVGRVLGDRRWETPTADGPAVVQGGVLVTDSGPVALPVAVRRVVARLISAGGGPLAREELEAEGASLDAILDATPALGPTLTVADGTVRLAGRPAPHPAGAEPVA